MKIIETVWRMKPRKMAIAECPSCENKYETSMQSAVKSSVCNACKFGKYSIKYEGLTIKQIAENYGLPRQLVYYRLKHNIPLTDAVKKTMGATPKLFTFQGKEMSVREIARLCGRTSDCIRYRIRKGILDKYESLGRK